MRVSQLPTWNRLRRLKGSGQVDVRHARWCRDNNLVQPGDFLALAGDVISGHRDRHVVEVRLDGKKLFLKKEHRVPFWTRIRNAWDGFGPVSLSEREAVTLTRLREAGVPVPRWIACGADGQGRAFLLLRNVCGKDLREVLARGIHDFCRWRLAQAIGEAIGRLHRAGFDAPDMSAKHVLVRRDGSVFLIDWPRAIERSTLNQDRCLHALAALHASVAPQLASMRERLTVLRVWMRTIGFHGSSAPLARKVIQLANGMGRRRSIREQLRNARSPRLRWIDGECLCVTTRFMRNTNEQTLDWLKQTARSLVPWRTMEIRNDSGHDPAFLCCFPPEPGWRRWFGRLMRRPMQSLAIRQAGLAFRLSRHGVPVTPVLAFGGRSDGGGFVMCHAARSMRTARGWLALPRPGRQKMLRQIGKLLRRCHHAGCRGINAGNLVIDTTDHIPLRLIPDGDLFSSTSPGERGVAADIVSLACGLGLTRRRDVALVVRGYFGTDAIKSESLRIAAESLGLTSRRAA